MSQAPRAATSPRELSWRQRKFLLEFSRAQTLAISLRAALEPARLSELADLHRIKAGIAHQSRRNLHCFLIIAGNRYREPGGGTVRFAFKDHVGERVEGAHQPSAGQIFLGSNTDAVALHFVGDSAVPTSHGIVGVEHDLARK